MTVNMYFVRLKKLKWVFNTFYTAPAKPSLLPAQHFVADVGESAFRNAKQGTIFRHSVWIYINLNKTSHTVLLAALCLHTILEKYKPVSSKVLEILLCIGGSADS